MQEPDYRELCESVLDLMCTASTCGDLTWVNPRWTELFGWSAAELTAAPLFGFLHPDDVEPARRALAELEADRSTTRFDTRIRAKSGEHHWLQWQIRSVQGRLIGVARDIGEEKRDQLDRLRRIETLDLAERLGRTGHWRIGVGNDALYWSPEVYRIHGLDPEAFTPTPVGADGAYHPDDRAMIRDVYEAVVSRKQPFELELRIVRPSGEIRLVQSLGRPEIDPATGEVVGIFGVFRDITDEDRQRRHEEMRQFAYVATHDLKEPVRTIRWFLDLLQEEELPDLSDTGATYAGFIRSAAVRLEGMLDALRRYSEAGEPRSQGAVELDTVLDEVWGALAARRTDRDVGIERPPALPTVRGNGAQLAQVFQNLLANAIKFSPDPACIRVEVRDGPIGEVQVGIRDNGPGIPPRYHRRIFGAFQRLQSTVEGTGIGLSIAKRALEQCRGRIWVESSEGRGATFWVALERA